MYEVTRRIEWDMGHRVHLHGGKCRSPHGHRYTAEITCVSNELTPEGFVVDFGEIKRRVGGWIDERLDHTFAYDRSDDLMRSWAAQVEVEGLKPFYEMTTPPTAENLAGELLGVARLLMDGTGISVSRVRVYETPNCWADC